MNLSFAQDNGRDVYSNEFGISTVESIRLDVKGNGFVDVEKKIMLGAETAGVVLPAHAEDYGVFGLNDEELVYTTEDLGNMVLLKFLGGEGNRVRILYSTDYLVGKNGSRWTVAYSTKATPQHTLIYIRFPSDTRILPLSSELLFSPMENGLILYPGTEVFDFSIEYELSDNKPDVFELSDFMLIGLVVLVFIVLALFYWVRGVQHKTKAVDDSIVVVDDSSGPRVMDSIKNTLDENEGKIIRMLEESDDEITQAYIYKSTGIPKSTLSEIISRLEKRNIVERRRDGRTNWLKIQKWVFE